jgi:hypothetical protein
VAVPEQTAAYISKSRAREPEMTYAEVFCPRPQRTRFALWGALLFELREAAFELSDARPTEIKSAWWADELLRSAQDAPRHPLMQALAAPQLPWNALARGLLAVTQVEAQRPSDRDAALAAVTPLADGIAAVEAMLFDAKETQSASRAIAVHLLGERLRVGLGAADGGRVPLVLLARHGITGAALTQSQGMPAVADWAAELAAALPSDLAGTVLYRRTRAAFDAWFLRELAADRTFGKLSSLRALRLAWHAARQTRSAI